MLILRELAHEPSKRWLAAKRARERAQRLRAEDAVRGEAVWLLEGSDGLLGRRAVPTVGGAG